MIKITLKILTVLILLAVGLGYFGILQLRSGPGLESETLTMEGLQEPVEILYDSMGVPHIFAESMEDLFLAQGYVHARDRLWQMEMFRRVLQGRLSEIMGESMVNTDRFLRTIGLEEAAIAGVPAPDSPFGKQTASYAQGVNAAMEGWSGLLPPEFVLLRFRPEPWSPSSARAWRRSWPGTSRTTRPASTWPTAREVLGDERLQPLMPAYPDWGVTIVDGWPDVEAGGRGARRPEWPGNVRSRPPSPRPLPRSSWPRPGLPTT